MFCQQKKITKKLCCSYFPSSSLPFHNKWKKCVGVFPVIYQPWYFLILRAKYSVFLRFIEPLIKILCHEMKRNIGIAVFVYFSSIKIVHDSSIHQEVFFPLSYYVLIFDKYFSLPVSLLWVKYNTPTPPPKQKSNKIFLCCWIAAKRRCALQQKM